MPIWWYRAPAVGPRVLPSGKVLWFLSRGQSSHYEIRRLNGSLVRTLTTANGGAVNVHDVQLLAGGNYLIGAHTRAHHVDTSAYGGSSETASLYCCARRALPLMEWLAARLTPPAPWG